MEDRIDILYIEDNAIVATIYLEILEEAGFFVKLAQDGNEAWDMYQRGNWDLILLDMELPGKDGYEIIRLIRERKDQIPIVILSSLNHNRALYEGADDYLVKGCSIDDVKARIDKAIARTRQMNVKQEQGIFHLSSFTEFNKNTGQLCLGNKKEALKGMEAKILWLFCLRINEIIPSVEMCENLWGFYSSDKERALTRYICLLNKKLKSDSSVVIKNEYGCGYKLISNSEQ